MREKFIIGLKYNYLTIISEPFRKVAASYNITAVKAECECGNIIETPLYPLKKGQPQSCGCMPRRTSKLVDLTGKKFKRWTVIKLHPKEKGQKETKWECICDCGKLGLVISGNLIKGISTSCGCLGRENVLKATTHHGLTGHPIHNLWRCMLYRCNNKNDPDYGGRGVKVCKEWENDFMSFYNWAIANGWQKGLQIDKDIKAREMGIEPLLYSPEMCQFVTRKKNCRSRRNSRIITCRGMTMTLAEFAELVGEKSDIIHERMRRGWSEEKAIFTPFKRKKECQI